MCPYPCNCCYIPLCPPAPACPTTLALAIVPGGVAVTYTPTYLPSRLVQLDWPNFPLMEFPLPPSGTVIAPAIEGTYTLTIPGCLNIAILDVPAVPCACNCPSDVILAQNGDQLIVTSAGVFDPYFARLIHPDTTEDIVHISIPIQVLVDPVQQGTYTLSSINCPFLLQQILVPPPADFLLSATADDPPHLQLTFTGGSGFDFRFTEFSFVLTMTEATTITSASPVDLGVLSGIPATIAYKAEGEVVQFFAWAPPAPLVDPATAVIGDKVGIVVIGPSGAANVLNGGGGSAVAFINGHVLTDTLSVVFSPTEIELFEGATSLAHLDIGVAPAAGTVVALAPGFVGFDGGAGGVGINSGGGGSASFASVGGDGGASGDFAVSGSDGGTGGGASSTITELCPGASGCNFRPAVDINSLLVDVGDGTGGKPLGLIYGLGGRSPMALSTGNSGPQGGLGLYGGGSGSGSVGAGFPGVALIVQQP